MHATVLSRSVCKLDSDDEVLACATLHNVLRKLTPDEYIEPGSMDKEIFESGTIKDGSWRGEATMIPLERNTTRNPGSRAKQIRK